MKNNQLKAGAMLSLLTFGAANVLGLLYTPYILRMMGQEEYGLYSLVASVVSYLTMLDFGFGNAIVRYTNLYRLSGTSDSTKAGLEKAKEMYVDLLEYIKKLENKSINLLFDRTFFTEENYCRLGKKQYSFTDVYEKLLEDFSKLDFETYYITLYLSDESLYNERLNREGKAAFQGSKFEAENSINQQRMYLKMAEEIKEK